MEKFRIGLTRYISLKIYFHKTKNLKVSFFIVGLRSQVIIWKTEAVVFMAPCMMHRSPILWNSPSMHSVKKWEAGHIVAEM